MFVLVYGLVDPRVHSLVCYVGITKNLRSRLRNHRKGNKGNPKLDSWIKRLRSERVFPQAIVLERGEVQVESAASYSSYMNAEKRWIKLWREKNPDLLNISEGGNAKPPRKNKKKQTLEQRQRNAETLRALWKKPEYMKTWKAAFARPETRKKHAASIRIALNRPDTRLRIREAALLRRGKPTGWALTPRKAFIGPRMRRGSITSGAEERKLARGKSWKRALYYCARCGGWRIKIVARPLCTCVTAC